MATVNLGRVKPVNKGTWSSATTYAIDDFVQYTDSGVLSTYIAVAASSNQTPSTSGTENGTYWKYMSKGTSLAVGNNKILVSDGSGNVTGQTIGTAGQVLKVNSGANGFEFGGAGTYSVHAFDQYANSAGFTDSQSNTDYIDCAGGKTVSFTPTSTDDIIYFSHFMAAQWGNVAHGFDAYLMMKAGSSSIGSGDIKLNYAGQHSVYTNTINDNYFQSSKAFYLPCTSLTVGTTYYVEQATAKHGSNPIQFNVNSSGANSGFGTGADRLLSHYVTAVHYTKN